MKRENPDADLETDLFGNPLVPIRDPRGRPAFARNKENQQVVIDLIGQGFKQEEISDYLGCDPKTLRKHFSRELEKGKSLLRGEAALVRARKMRMGNMAATKAILDDGNALPPARSKPKPAAEGREQPLGKKEALDRAASTPSGGWGDILN